LFLSLLRSKQNSFEECLEYNSDGDGNNCLKFLFRIATLDELIPRDYDDGFTVLHHVVEYSAPLAATILLDNGARKYLHVKWCDPCPISSALVFQRMQHCQRDYFVQF
jgi:hypothetical protein